MKITNTRKVKKKTKLVTWTRWNDWLRFVRSGGWVRGNHGKKKQLNSVSLGYDIR